MIEDQEKAQEFNQPSHKTPEETTSPSNVLPDTIEDPQTLSSGLHTIGSQAETVSSPQNQPEVTGAYRGGRGPGYEDRGLKGYEMLTGVGYDELLTRILAAKRPDENGVVTLTILDFGCGTAQFFTDLLSQPEMTQKLRQYMQANSNIHYQLNLIGITGEEPPPGTRYENIVPTYKKSEDILPQNCSTNAKKYFYSLTDKQTFAQFLRQIQIEPKGSIDLLLAVENLMYLKPNTFDIFLHNAYEALSDTGMFAASDYSGEMFVSGRLSKNNARESNHSRRPLDDLLKESRDLLVPGRVISLTDAQAITQKTFHRLENLHMLSAVDRERIEGLVKEDNLIEAVRDLRDIIRGKRGEIMATMHKAILAKKNSSISQVYQEIAAQNDKTQASFHDNRLIIVKPGILSSGNR